MQGSIEDMAYTVGGALVSPSLGSAELILALLVACGFAFSAIQSAVAGRKDEARWH
ncbi:hypothetical protein [Microvirga pudoricolor]|uniref:hypothetical protein n=1 Tax=Microvirga pudoricolor TaxID=2778729 RepID=UPI00194F642D|nr:hypothetical protein [Microvirga pudoricolor]MBM6592783.1 hypothetical protein [Microvirga pudoricolor]